MSVAEIGQLHNRYVRISDKFKSLWTYHQFAAGVYKTFVQRRLPYEIDFQKVYESIRKAGDIIQSSSAPSAAQMMEKTDHDMQAVISALLEADLVITAPILRRFFEKLKRQDEKIVFHLIKFYLYANAIEGDQRDKIDFLVTRIGEDFIEERDEYSSKDSLELRKHFQSLLAIRPMNFVPQQEIINIIRTMRGIRDEIQHSDSFEDLVDRKLLEKERLLKHRIGEQFFHPDVLLAVVECNVATKNRFSRLYQDEEKRILEDSRKLLEHEEAIVRGFGETNPQLLEEIARFREFKKEFDESRAQSNVKHAVIGQLKTSMNNILAQLDRGLDRPAQEAGEEAASDTLFLQAQQADNIQTRFGDDPLLHPYLQKIVSVLDGFDRDLSFGKLVESKEAKRLRLEAWEAEAFQKLYWNRPLLPDENEDVLLLYLRAAALRIKIDDEARALASHPFRTPVEGGLLERIKASLDRAKELDRTFSEFLTDDQRRSNARAMHRLYRSRFRLLRGFSGLWLIYDQQTVK